MTGTLKNQVDVAVFYKMTPSLVLYVVRITIKYYYYYVCRYIKAKLYNNMCISYVCIYM